MGSSGTGVIDIENSPSQVPDVVSCVCACVCVCVCVCVYIYIYKFLRVVNARLKRSIRSSSERSSSV